MNIRSFLPAAFWLLSGLFASSAFAQSDTPSPNAVTISFVSFGDMPQGLQFQDGDKTVSPGIPAMVLSHPFQYGGGSPFVLFKQGVDANGQPVRVPVATASFPVSWKKILIVFMPGAHSADPVSALAFDDSGDGFPAGYIRLFNFHPGPLAIASGDTIDQIAVGQSKMVQMSARDPYGRVWFKMAVMKDSQWRKLPSWTMVSVSTSRAVVFAYERAVPNRDIQDFYLTVPEDLPPPKPASGVASQ